jgi:hypothetical protein
MSTEDEKKVDPIKEILKLIKNSSNLDNWGFKESYQSVKSNVLIYDSEWCRMSFSWGGWDNLGGNSISVHYGRLHAPNEDAKMVWNGEECYAWHEFEYPLHFLDARSPAEASELDLSHPLTNKYYSDDFSKKFHRRQPEWLMQMHMEVWDNYGERLFELFDLRQPQLWEQYGKFLKEFYDIKGRLPFIKPAMDKVC